MASQIAHADREPSGPTPRKRLTAAERCTILDRQHDLCPGCRESLIWTVVDGKSVYGPMIDEHIIPLELGGSNDLSNRELRCIPCAKVKTKKDQKDIGHVRRMRLKDQGEFPKARQTIRSAGFRKRWTP
jgi:5-methylcytosine-specific restriction endonuclease McrA